MERGNFEEIYQRIESYTDEAKISFLEDYIRKANMDKFSAAVLYESLGNLSIKMKNAGGEYFEKAGSLFENCWSISHIQSTKMSKQRGLLLRALKNYRIAHRFYNAVGLKISEARTLRRISDIEVQLKNYPGAMKQMVVFLVLFSFLASITLFSHNITGLSIAEANDEQSFILGGILFFVAVVGIAYIIFFGLFYYNGQTILRKVNQ